MEKKVLPNSWYIRGCDELVNYLESLGVTEVKGSACYSGYWLDGKNRWRYDNLKKLSIDKSLVEITVQDYIDSLDIELNSESSDTVAKINLVAPLKEDSEKPNTFDVTEMRGEDFKSLKVGDKVDMGDFTVEAFSNNEKGSCAECVFKGTENYNICNKCYELIDDNLNFKLVDSKEKQELEAFEKDLSPIYDNRHPFEKITKDLFELYKRKNKDYGDSFSKGFSEYGIIMPCIRLEDKFLRFKQLAKGFKPEVQDEKIEDTLIDMANYAIMTLIELGKVKNK